MRAEGDAADAAAAQVLLHLAGEVDLHALVLGLDLHGVVDRRQVAFVELGVERRADDLRDVALLRCGSDHVVSGKLQSSLLAKNHKRIRRPASTSATMRRIAWLQRG